MLSLIKSQPVKSTINFNKHTQEETQIAQV